MKRKETVFCCACSKGPLSQNEVGINQKLLGSDTMQMYCLDCLAEYLEVTPQDILDKIEEFKAEGCKLFE